MTNAHQIPLTPEEIAALKEMPDCYSDHRSYTSLDHLRACQRGEALGDKVKPKKKKAKASSPRRLTKDEEAVILSHQPSARKAGELAMLLNVSSRSVRGAWTRHGMRIPQAKMGRAPGDPW